MMYRSGLRLMIAVAMLAILAAALYARARLGITWESIAMQRADLISRVNRHLALAALIALAAYTLLVTFSIPLANVLTLTCGMLFGRWLGTAIVVIGASVGATLFLLLIRYLAHAAAERFICKRPRLRKLVDGFDTGATRYILFLRLMPVFPFWLVNLVVALTRVQAGRFFLLTLVGIIPGTFIYVNVGATLGRIESPEQILSIPVFITLALLALLMLQPKIFRRFSDRSPV